MRPRAVVLAVLCAGLVLLPAAAAAEPARPAATGGLWGPPLDGDLTVTRPFERLPHPYAAGHRGADLPGRPDQPVLAAGGGVVVFAGLVAGRPVVSIDHSDGLRTTYEPVHPSVAAGQRVARGSPIGTLRTGHAGCPGEACLHWGLRRDETYLDPLLLLRPPRVRLLPMAEPQMASPSITRRQGRSTSVLPYGVLELDPALTMVARAASTAVGPTIST